MNKYRYILVFLLSILAGMAIGTAPNYKFIYQESHTVKAPEAIPEIDYTSGYYTSGETVNINTAPVQELDTLPGIGEGFAKRIIKYRTITGRFEVPEDIMKVPGIGETRFLKIKDKISVE